MTAKKASNQHVRVVTRFVKKPEELTEGCVRCLGCSAVVGLTPTGRMHSHSSPGGEPCAYNVVHAEPVRLEQVPEVNIPRQPTYRARGARPSGVAASTAPRLVAGSRCADCGKWIPGERSLCGRCYAHHDQNRNKR